MNRLMRHTLPRLRADLCKQIHRYVRRWEAPMILHWRRDLLRFPTFKKVPAPKASHLEQRQALPGIVFFCHQMTASQLRRPDMYWEYWV